MDGAPAALAGEAGESAAAHRPHVVAVPYPGRGHVNPMLCLCSQLASGGVPVTFVVTEEWHQLLLAPSLSPFASRSPSLLTFRTIPNVIPSEKGRGSDFLGFLRDVFSKMTAPFEELLRQLDRPPSLILTDPSMAWPAEVAARQGVAVAALWPQSATGLLAVLSLQRRLAAMGKEEESDVVFEDANGWLDYMPRYDYSKPLKSEMITAGIMRTVVESFAWIRNGAHNLLLTSFQDLEPDAINTLSQELPCKVYPIGPSIPYMMMHTDPSMDKHEHYFKWLNSQPKSSVLYISLGSFFPISAAQMEEIAIALHDTSCPFIWVTRSEASVHLQELSGVMGLVVPWCKQLEVLCHPSVGGFFTHCGWNSVQEGVYAGKPMLGFPLFWDQSPNCRLIEKWGIGMRLKGEAQGVVGREKIKQGVRCLMVLDGNGRSWEIRRRARELGEVCRMAVEVGGTSYESLDQFIGDCRMHL